MLRSGAVSLYWILNCVESMSEKNRGNMGKKIAEKLRVIREVDENERSKS